MKKLRTTAAALAMIALLSGTGCAAERADADPAIDTARATGECEVIAGLLTGDYELDPGNVEELLVILANLSDHGYPQSAKAADMIIASYGEEPPSQEEADAVILEWADFCEAHATG